MPRKPRKSTPSLGDELHIEWNDATAKQGWFDQRAEHLPIHKIVSTGFLVRDTPEYLTIASDIDMNCAIISRAQSIPKGCIRSITVRTPNAIDERFYSDNS